jgi:hypothetical protein
MTRKSTPTNAKPATSRSRTDRQAVTLEMVARLAPHQGLTDNLVRTFGLEPVDYDGIRDATQEHIAQGAQAFGTALNEKALQIHLQRIVGSFVSSAFGAAQFYGTKKSAAMELTSRLLNDNRDEDRDGPIGFESKAERARLFAAEMALQSFALLAAAEGAIAAYAEITGETWKPYEAPLAPAATVSRQSAAAEMAAFQAANAPGRGGAGRGSAPLVVEDRRRGFDPCAFFHSQSSYVRHGAQKSSRQYCVSRGASVL